ncbi:MAG: RNA-binding protein [Alphaproteobacteria bacterium]
MNEAPDIPISELVDKRGHKGPERRCAATGETYDKSLLIRFVRGPDGSVVPDVAEKLPGRGVWVSADYMSVEKAIKIKAFARGFKAKVSVPDNLGDIIEAQLSQRVLSMIGMALKSGAIVMGYDQVKGAARGDHLAWRIEASDGSDDGRSKIRVLTRAVSRQLEMPVPGVIGCFTASQLGEALGRESIVHAAIKPGKLAAGLSRAVKRLSGFRALVPESWPDASHEAVK